MQFSRILPIAFLFALAACGTAYDGPFELDELDADSGAIVNGSRDPRNITLTEGEKLAIVYLADPWGSEFCTGTLIHPRAVISARHCVDQYGSIISPSDVKIGFGLMPSNPDALMPVSVVEAHPTIDFSLLILSGFATDEVPGVETIAMNREAITNSWIGRWVDASGYGETYSSNTGRYFASVQIYTYDTYTVSVDGHGSQGICYGDSGGPILWQNGSTAPPVVVGTEQWGDSSCVDRDHLTRVDMMADWVDDKLATVMPPVPCGNVTYQGRCDGEVLSWCSDQGLQVQDCGAAGQICVWVDNATGYDCRNCTYCNGQCTDMQSSPDHCGSCNNPCAPANAFGVCQAGQCKVSTCVLGYLDRDGNSANGCEVSEEDEEEATRSGCACASSTGAGMGWAWLAALLSLGWRRRR